MPLIAFWYFFGGREGGGRGGTVNKMGKCDVELGNVMGNVCEWMGNGEFRWEIGEWGWG